MPPHVSEKVSLGTTIMAASFDGGVILAADSRTSTGKYVANRAAAKLTQLSPNVFICRSGSAADTQAVAAYVQLYLAQHQIELGSDIRVETAATVAMQMVYGNKDNLSCGLIVGGWDAAEGGQVFAIPMGGTLLKVPYSIGGSGSAYITGFCDKFWKEKMSQDQCREFCLRAVSHAIARDGSSGGCIRMVTINKEGVHTEFVPHTSVPQHYGEKSIAGFKGFEAQSVSMST